MAYSENLAQRIRQYLVHLNDVEEKEMMGGLTFMVNGKMCIGIIKEEIMCRINPEMQETALQKPGCRIMDFTGRPMKGYVMVEDSGRTIEKDFKFWIELCLDFNKIAKSSKKKKSR